MVEGILAFHEDDECLKLQMPLRPDYLDSLEEKREAGERLVMMQKDCLTVAVLVVETQGCPLREMLMTMIPFSIPA